MSKTKSLLLAAAAAAMGFTVSCSGDDGASSGGYTGSYGSVTHGGKTYKTVNIGYQTWMAENLNYDIEGSKCYDDDPANCEIYGRLYDWSTTMDFSQDCNESYCSSQVQSPHKGICPSGWHIPSNDDWDKLYRFADGTSGTESGYSSPTAGKHLKAVSGWKSYVSGWEPYDSIENLDTHGFSALPGGLGISEYWGGGFDHVGERGDWWSTSEISSTYAYVRYMSYNSVHANRNPEGKSYLYSVRCLQD